MFFGMKVEEDIEFEISGMVVRSPGTYFIHIMVNESLSVITTSM